MKRHSIAILLFSSLSASMLQAELICPSNIRTEQSVANADTGYEVGEKNPDLPSRLKLVEFYMEHPREGMLITSTIVSEEEKIITAQWEFSEVERKSGVFFRCEYSDTKIVLTKKLPFEIKKCVVEYRKSVWITADARKIEKIVCKQW